MSIERWLPVVGFEGFYEVSDFGRVKRCCTVVDVGGTGAGTSYGSRRPIAERIMRTPANSSGYPLLSLSRNGSRKNHYVHALVAEAFLGPRPDGYEVAHRDGNRLNPKAANLMYATPSENNLQKTQHGTSQHGEGNGRSKLTEDVVAAIKALPPEVPHRWVARAIGISSQAVFYIRTGRNWQHVKPEPGEVCPSLHAAFLAGSDGLPVLERFTPSKTARRTMGESQ